MAYLTTQVSLSSPWVRWWSTSLPKFRLVGRQKKQYSQHGGIQRLSNSPLETYGWCHSALSTLLYCHWVLIEQIINTNTWSEQSLQIGGITWGIFILIGLLFQLLVGCQGQCKHSTANPKQWVSIFLISGNKSQTGFRCVYHQVSFLELGSWCAVGFRGFHWK